MAISKVILNGNSLMDVTQDTVQANNLLSGNTATKNDGTKVNGSVAQKSAQTYIPTTTDQTIASGQYLTGVQTIKGDANLLAENIKKDVVIFGITGTYEGDAPSGGGSTPVSFNISFGSGYAYYIDLNGTYNETQIRPLEPMQEDKQFSRSVKSGTLITVVIGSRNSYVKDQTNCTAVKSIDNGTSGNYKTIIIVQAN